MKAKCIFAALVFLSLLILTSCAKKIESPPSELVIKAFEINMIEQFNKPVGSYTPLMSSVPGFPFELAFKNSKITIEVDCGNILLWGDDTNQKVIDKGKNITLSSPCKIFWSPLDGESSNPNKAIMKISFTSGNQSVDATIELNSDLNGFYTATLVHWSTNYMK
jgi:hypothetical protein